jgi:hypothetical protein
MNKSVILILCTVFTIIVMVSSCSNKLDEPGFPGFRCDLNGTEYVADTAYYTKSLGTVIYAYTGSKRTFAFFLQSNTDSIGSYPLDTTGHGSYAYYYDGTTTYQSISGSVNLTQYYNDSLKVLNGTFSFTGRVPGASGNTVNIQYGYLNNIPRH